MNGAFDPTVGPLVRLYGREGGRPPTAKEVALTLERVGWAEVVLTSQPQAIHFRRPRMELDLGGIASHASDPRYCHLRRTRCIRNPIGRVR